MSPVTDRTVRILQRQFPHVDDIADWRAQQTIRLLWDRVFDLEGRLQATETSADDLIGASNDQATSLSDATRLAEQALAEAQQTAQEIEAGPGVKPRLHAATHQTGGTDLVDVKLLGGYPGGTTTFLRADHTFVAPSGTPPGGSTTQVQFNDSGAFGGDAGLIYDKVDDRLVVGGQVTAGGDVIFTADKVIRRNTADGSDTGFVALCGGGDNLTSRGGVLGVFGNENAGNAGSIHLSPGNVTGSKLRVARTDGVYAVEVASSDGSAISRSNVGAAWLFDWTAATGGYVTFRSNAADRGFIGSAALLFGGSVNDLALRAEANLDLGIGATRIMRLTTGVQIGSPTGGDKGAGTLNAVAVYDDNVLLTDWLFDLYYDGRVRADDPFYRGQRLYSLAEVAETTRSERRLPWMPSRADFDLRRSLGALITALWQGQEQQQLYLVELQAAVEALTEAVRAGGSTRVS